MMYIHLPTDPKAEHFLSLAAYRELDDVSSDGGSGV